MTEWQPIETAPRDGTWIRLWRGRKGVFSENTERAPEVIGRFWVWEDGSGEWVWPDNWGRSCDPWHKLEWANADIEAGNYFADAVNFTHWMPLPDPPEVQQ